MEKSRLKLIDDTFHNVKDKLTQFYKKPENSEKVFMEIKKYISEKANIDLALYRENFLHRRIYYRLLRININSYSEYLIYLKSHPEEYKSFLESFTIHVTDFFRDVTPFRYLEEVLFAKLINMKIGADRTIRILSAPCSTGEEPYSIAMIVDAMKRKNLIPNPVEIYACDLEPKVVEFARAGIYSKDTMKNISEDSMRRNFIESGDGLVALRPNIKSYVQFFVQDLLKALPDRKYDLVVCRNFLIYISKDNQKVVINNFMTRMVPMAYLMLGKTEGFPLLSAQQFSPESLKEHIYRLAPKPTK